MIVHLIKLLYRFIIDNTEMFSDKKYMSESNGRTCPGGAKPIVSLFLLLLLNNNNNNNNVFYFNRMNSTFSYTN